MAVEHFDYVIIGAGSAGSVLAARLSEDPSTRVLLLEFGGSDRSVLIQMPSALSIPMNMDKYNWGYESEPEPGLGGRRMNLPRGKVLGGSSSINGMVYVRGAHRISTAGRPRARTAGPMPTSCPISAGRKRGRTAATPIAAARERCIPAMAA